MAKRQKEPEYYLSPIHTELLNYKVYKMKLIENLMYSILLLLAGGLVGLVFYGGLFRDDATGARTGATWISDGAVFALFGFLARFIFLPEVRKLLLRKRQESLRKQFRDYLVAVSSAASGGRNMTDSFISAERDMHGQYEQDAFIIKEAAEIVACVRNNVPAEEALDSLGFRSGVDDIVNFAVICRTCIETGGNMKEVIRRTTEMISEKLIINEEIETQLTSNKLQMYAMNVIPVCMMLMLRFISSDFAKSFRTPLGMIAITFGIFFFVGSFKLGQKIMDIRG